MTLDTNVLPAEDLLEAARNLDCEFAVVSVTGREVEGTPFRRPGRIDNPRIPNRILHARDAALPRPRTSI